MKLGPLTTSPGLTAPRFWLPMFCKVTDCGLSSLVKPTYVVEKLNDGVCA